MNDGKFVEDEIVNKLLEKIIFDSERKNKLIFDGYPRTLNQAKNLENLLTKSNQKIDYIFSLIQKFHLSLCILDQMGYLENLEILNIFFLYLF